MFCPNCGAQILEDSVFCPECGTVLDAPERFQYEAPQYDTPPAKRNGGVIMLAVVCTVISVLFGAMLFGGWLGDGGLMGYLQNRKAETTEERHTPSGGTDSGRDEGWLLDGGADSEAYKQFTTYALPVEADFDWFYDRLAGTVNAAIPDGATIVTDPALLFGGWKCFILCRPTTEPFCQYWNIDLSIADSEVACIQSWSGQVKSGGEFEDMSGADTNSLTGSISRNGVMELTDGYGNVFTVILWYSHDGKQYGMGTYECVWDEESVGIVAVCRP